MKKKTFILFAIFLVILVGIGCIFQYRYTHQSIKSFAAAMCTAKEIIVTESGSYLEVQFDDERHTVKKIAVKDENVLKKISESNIRDIIGVNIASEIPKSVLEENHSSLNINTFNSMQLLVETDIYDTFFEIVDVSFVEKRSFVGDVIEETTTYMIVEPVYEKVDEYIAEKVKVEYGTDHHDYLYGVGRRVVIYYQGEPEEIEDGMKLIKSDDISTEGFREFKLEIKPSEEKVKKEIAERTQPTDSSGKRWIYGNSALYYYGVENVLITIKGWTMPLEKALEEGRITLNGIIAKCNQDVAGGVIDELVYKDGGSQVYKYPDYTIVKYHTLDGNDDMYFGTPDIDIHVKDK